MSSDSSLKSKLRKLFHLNSSANHSISTAIIKENAKLAWHGFKVLSKNAERLLDGTPFKIPVGVINSIVAIVDTIIESKDSMAVILLEIGQRLEIVNMNFEHMWRPDGIDPSCQRFSKVLNDAEAELKEMDKQGILKRILESNEHPKQLEDIFRRIDEATKTFQLDLTLATARQVKGIVQNTEILRLDNLKPSREARYADVARQPCVEGTREEIIESITAWYMDDAPDCPPIYWLSGMAGTGKSTIAYTICKNLYDGGNKSGRLGASFFCSRQIEAARLRKNVIPTIVHDLAHSFPDFGRALLTSKFDAQPSPLKDHIQSLLSDPWRSVTANQALPPLVVVIDALDELEGKDGSFFLEQLIKEVSLHENGFRGLKFFVTSRQDPRIVKICDSIDSRAVCRLEEVPFDIIENDIHLYLRAALPNLDTSTLRTLAKQSSGLFIYAATAVRFINPPSQLEEPTLRKQTERLNLLLRAWPEKSECEVDGLLVDCLYEEILSLWLSPKSKAQQRIARAILQTVICTEEPILLTDIPRFLESEFDLEEEEVLNLILSLHTVLYLLENRAYSYHKSFLDFMTNTTRFASQELATMLCPTPERQVCLTISCFRIMSSLRFNICDLPSSYLNDSEVADLPTRIDENIPYALRYACCHWAKHMSKAPPDKQALEKMLTMAHQKWMEYHLLFWIEAMNLLKVVRECYSLLVMARQWLEKNVTLELEQKKNLMAAENLVTSFGSMGASTPHLYVSVLATYTWESPLISRWRDRFPRIPTVAVMLNEDLPIATLRLPDNFVSSKSNWLFLADGIHIVGTDMQGKLVLWDISTGQFQMKAMEEHEKMDHLSTSPDGKNIAGHNKWTVWIWEVPKWKESHRLEGFIRINSVIFSPDGTRIMIADLDCLHIRDTSTWNELLTKNISTNSTCFSPDGKCIASGSNGTVRIWDVSNGNELHRLYGEPSCIFSLEFSPDGTQILSGSGMDEFTFLGLSRNVSRNVSKHTVQIWDMSNGNELYQLAEEGIKSAYFSPDGMFVASISGNGVHIWDASNGNKLHRLSSNTFLQETCFSPDGTHFLTMSDSIIHISDPSTGKELYQLVERDFPESASFSSDRTRILSMGSDYLTLWDVPTKKTKQYQLAGSSAGVQSTHFSPDGKQIVTLSNDGTLWILDATTLTETQQLRTGQSCHETEEACFTADGTHIVLSDHDGRRFDVLTGELLEADEMYAEDPEDPELFDCTRSGTLRVDQSDYSLKFRNVSAGGQMDDISRSQFTCHGSKANSVNNFSFSQDGSRLVTGSDDATVCIWDTSTGEELKRLEAHNDGVYSVCLSPNGKQIVSGSDDTTVRIWDVPGMQECQCRGSNNSVGVFPGGVRLDACPSYHSRAATWTFLDSDTIRRDWCVDSDGWVKSSKGEQYFWLSKQMHTYLNRPDSVAISARGSVEIDFTTGHFGERWADCYEPGAL